MGAFRLRRFASPASAVLAAGLSSRHVRRFLRPGQVTHLSREQQPLSDHFHLHAAPYIPEGADRLVVGRPLHVDAVDLDGHVSNLGAGESKGHESEVGS